MEAEIAVQLPQAKEHQELPETGRDKERFSSKAFGENMVLLTHQFQISHFQTCERTTFSCYKHPLCNLLWQSRDANTSGHYFFFYSAQQVDMVPFQKDLECNLKYILVECLESYLKVTWCPLQSRNSGSVN